jgi:hypothetical protein
MAEKAPSIEKHEVQDHEVYGMQPLHFERFMSGVRCSNYYHQAGEVLS